MKKTGVTTLSIVVAIAAFVVATVWAGGLNETRQKYQDAIDRWDRTDQATVQSSVVLANTVLQGRDWLDQMSRLLDTEMSALGNLFHDGITFGKMPDMLGKMNDEQKKLDEEENKVVTSDDAARVGANMKQLIKSASTFGASIKIFTEEKRDNLDKRGTLVKYGGYVLGILAIVVAGIASMR